MIYRKTFKLNSGYIYVIGLTQARYSLFLDVAKKRKEEGKMKMKKLLIVIVALVLACSLVQAVGAKLAYHWGWGLPGDVNGDGKVDMRDISTVARAFGSTPGSPNWNPKADINLDGIIDMKDVGIASAEFGLYVKKEVDYQALACDSNYIPYAVAAAKLFILNNNMFYVSVEWAQDLPMMMTECAFQVGQEGSGIQGAQDDRTPSGYFYYVEGWTGTGFGLPIPWYAKGYYYVAMFPSLVSWYQFEMWGTLSGTTTYTMLYLLTNSGGLGGWTCADEDFQIVHY